MVEHAAVNRVVVGSSPTSGATSFPRELAGFRGSKVGKRRKCQQKCQQIGPARGESLTIRA